MFLKCKMCGGALDLNDFKNNHVIECPYCGSAQTIPDVNDEKLEELHNKANSLRLASEFDEAMIIYHELLSKNSKDSEAHFGLVLCKYGIEYVTDPKTNKKIPTCHRLQTKSIFDDVNYKEAINNADFLSKMYYETEGRRIDEIMKDTLLVSQKEEPYDVFISYKETNSNNERTEDSAIAETIYHNLVNKGYKVFYSKITLASKLGNEYEPIIYSALMSSKVMLLIGTSVENINSVWVKNEWSRYLGFMETDRKKHLMPCYKYFDPYLLPKELRNFQGQDLNAFGYDLDIIRGVEKVLGVKKVVKENSRVDNLINRIKILIGDNELKDALGLTEDILNIDAYSSEAYLYKAVLKHNLTEPLELASLGKKLFNDKDYKHAKEFKNSKTEALILEIEEKINEEIKRLEAEKALAEAKRLEALRLEKEKKEQELKLEAEKKAKEAEEAALKLKLEEEKAEAAKRQQALDREALEQKKKEARENYLAKLSELKYGVRLIKVGLNKDLRVNKDFLRGAHALLDDLDSAKANKFFNKIDKNVDTTRFLDSLIFEQASFKHAFEFQEDASKLYSLIKSDLKPYGFNLEISLDLLKRDLKNIEALTLQKKDELEPLYKEALKAFKTKDYKEAYKLFKECNLSITKFPLGVKYYSFYHYKDSNDYLRLCSLLMNGEKTRETDTIEAKKLFDNYKFYDAYELFYKHRYYGHNLMYCNFILYLAREDLYDYARKLEENELYSDAEFAYQKIRFYKDSNDRRIKCHDLNSKALYGRNLLYNDILDEKVGD